MINKAAMIGTGAVGAVYAKYLYEFYGDNFYVIAGNERKQRIEKKGLTVNQTTFYPKMSDITDNEIFDLIIIGVKNYDLEQAIKDIKNHVDDNTILLPLLNGITASDRLSKAYPNSRVLMGLSMGIDAIRNENGVVYTDDGVVQFGYADNTNPMPEVLAVEKYLSDARIPCKVCTDMKRMLWRKWMLNVGVNQSSAAVGAKFKYFAKNDELFQIFEKAMLEVLALAEAEKVNLTMEDVKDLEQVIINFTPEGKTSMLQDVEAERRTEIDYFAGTVIEYGKKNNIPTPVNDMLYLIIKGKEKVYLGCEDK